MRLFAFLPDCRVAPRYVVGIGVMLGEPAIEFGALSVRKGYCQAKPFGDWKPQHLIEIDLHD